MHTPVSAAHPDLLQLRDDALRMVAMVADGNYLFGTSTTPAPK